MNVQKFLAEHPTAESRRAAMMADAAKIRERNKAIILNSGKGGKRTGATEEIRAVITGKFLTTSQIVQATNHTAWTVRCVLSRDVNRGTVIKKNIKGVVHWTKKKESEATQ